LSAEAVTPAGWTWQPTGEKFAEWWERQDVTARNVWLRSMGVRLEFEYAADDSSPSVRLDLGDLETLLREMNASGPAADWQDFSKAMQENGIAGMEISGDSVVFVSADGRRVKTPALAVADRKGE
jgi:site-specific DNA recombinase